MKNSISRISQALNDAYENIDRGAGLPPGGLEFGRQLQGGQTLLPGSRLGLRDPESIAKRDHRDSPGQAVLLRSRVPEAFRLLRRLQRDLHRWIRLSHEILICLKKVFIYWVSDKISIPNSNSYRYSILSQSWPWKWINSTRLIHKALYDFFKMFSTSFLVLESRYFRIF